MVNINSWNAIRWSSMEKNVLCLQLKIYKAAANLELEKLYKFQKLLISSKAAKYLSVRKVTEKNSGKIPLKVYSIIIKTPSIKFALAEQLILNEKYLDFRPYSSTECKPLKWCKIATSKNIKSSGAIQKILWLF